MQWSDELYRIFGRSPQDGPLTLDELPSWLFSEDQQLLTEMVTGCLVDGRPIDGEFRIVRADGSVRTVHMVGEPVLGADGGTASMWAVIRDVSDLRRSQRTLRETRDSLERQRQIAQTERRLAVELQEAVLPPWRGALRFPPEGGPATLDLAAHYLPSATSGLIGGDWYDAMQLPDGSSLLTVGDLTGHGVAATSGMAMLLGALRGMAVAGLQPGPLMGWLNELLDTSAAARAGQRAVLPLRPRDPGAALVAGRAPRPAAVPRRDGARPRAAGRRAARRDLGRAVRPGRRAARPGRPAAAAHRRPGAAALGRRRRAWRAAPDRLLDMAPRFADAASAQDCLRMVAEEFGVPDREDDACVLIARIV